jgi:tagatose-6-phosphate ketose/aldose isomerase
MGLLGYSNADLLRKGGIYTATEISGQPQLWMKTFEKLEKEKKSIHGFLEAVIPRVAMAILTGAGTSALIDLSLKECWSRFIHANTQVIATTDFITHPLNFISSETSLLLISFAGSENSPESVAAVKIYNYL